VVRDDERDGEEARVQDGGQGEEAGGRDVEEAWPIQLYCSQLYYSQGRDVE